MKPRRVAEPRSPVPCDAPDTQSSSRAPSQHAEEGPDVLSDEEIDRLLAESEDLPMSPETVERLTSDVLQTAENEARVARAGRRRARYVSMRRVLALVLLTLGLGLAAAPTLHRFWTGRHSTTTLPYSEALDIYTGRRPGTTDEVRSAQALLFSHVDAAVRVLKTLRESGDAGLAADARRGLEQFRATLRTHVAPLPTRPEVIALRDLLRFVGDGASEPTKRREYLRQVVEHSRLGLAALYREQPLDPNVAADQQKLQHKLEAVLLP